jgi:hypothetical protein
VGTKRKGKTMIKIPKQIELMGHVIKIVWVDTLVHEQDALGLADYRNHQIKLQKNTKAYPIPDTVIYQAYLHEVLHFICGFLKLEELQHDEKTIDSIAGLLYQALKETK